MSYTKSFADSIAECFVGYFAADVRINSGFAPVELEQDTTHIDVLPGQQHSRCSRGFQAQRHDELAVRILVRKRLMAKSAVKKGQPNVSVDDVDALMMLAEQVRDTLLGIEDDYLLTDSVKLIPVDAAELASGVFKVELLAAFKAQQRI